MNKPEGGPPDQAEQELKDWEANEVAAFLKKQGERREEFFTMGDFPVKRVYTPADARETPPEDIGPARPLPVHPRPLPPPCIAAACGRCARSPASAPARTPTGGSNT